MSLGFALALLFAGAVWTHIVASVTEDEEARRHYKLVSGATAAAVIAGFVAAEVASGVLDQLHVELTTNSGRWFGFAVGVATYLWMVFHDVWQKKPSQERQPLTPAAPPAQRSALQEMLDTPPDAPLVEIVHRWQQDPLGKASAPAATTPPEPAVSAPASSAPTPPPSKQEN